LCNRLHDAIGGDVGFVMALGVTGDGDDTVTFSDAGWTPGGFSGGAITVTNGQARLVIDSGIALSGAGAREVAIAVDLASLDGTDGFRLDWIDANDQSRRSVSGAGDVNGDGTSDSDIFVTGANLVAGDFVLQVQPTSQAAV
jgi:hypothetical protein